MPRTLCAGLRPQGNIRRDHHLGEEMSQPPATHHETDAQRWIHETEQHVRTEMLGEGSGHDWWHIERVLKNARLISRDEPVDSLTVELAALLHDIADHKFHNGDDTVGPKVAREWLESIGVDEGTVAHVCEIIGTLSFKGAGTTSHMKSREGMVVQDADRLDAIGAIGIARTFAYGGYANREIYNPETPPVQHGSFAEYKSNTSPTINHFYEKLLLLKDRMNTQSARRIAEERHRFMETYLEQFYREWNGEA
jgi:uncharacterized protein